ncbi:hypothetical protein OHT20_17565 [Streptomyces caniferus]|uniref:hypothetical protein n=1 Tax=Streptomyces caniferus TaxID=285557 RepID=UPI002E2C9A55|nr:hypothetical protein [Streptomyces caniferus]
MTTHQDCEEAHPGQAAAEAAHSCHTEKHSTEASTPCGATDKHDHTGHAHTDHEDHAEGDGCEEICTEPDACHSD